MLFGLFSNKKSNTDDAGNSVYAELVKHLILLIQTPTKATSVIIEGRNFIDLPVDRQKKAVTAVYLLFEKYCCEVDVENPQSRDDFRIGISQKFPWVKTHPELETVFMKNQKQAVVILCATFLRELLFPLIDLTGNRQDGLLSNQIQLLDSIISKGEPVSYHFNQLRIRSDSASFQELKNFSLHLFQDLSKRFGHSNIENLYGKAYQKIKNTYLDYNLFPKVAELIPTQLINQEHLRILGVKQIQEMLNTQIEQLEKLNHKLVKEAEEKRLLNETLKERSSNLQKIFDGNLDAVIVVDDNNKINYWNERAEQVFGYSRREALNKSLPELIIPPKLHIRHNHGMSRYLNLAQEIKTDRKLEVDGLHKNGSTIPLELRLTEYQDKDKQFFVSFIRDLSGHKEHETGLIKDRDQAKDNSEAKSKFLTIISHEVKTPLNAIIAFSDLLYETELNETQKEYLSHIKSSGFGLLELINDLIKLDKLNEGRLTIKPRLGNFRAEIEKITSPYSLLIQQKGLEFTLNIEEALPMNLKLDYLRLGQVLINLINNSIEFTKTGGIRLGINYDLSDYGDLTLTFIVSDSGKGISEEEMKSIFSPNIYEDDTSTEKYGASAIGLGISKEITELMGGKITAHSPSKHFPGKGSDFKFSIKTKLG